MSHIHEFWLLPLLLVILTLAQVLFVPTAEFADYELGHDIRQYRRMAVSAPEVDQSVSPPFSSRILGPWLAGLLFESPDFGFRLLNTVFSVVYILLFYRFLLDLRVDRRLAFYVTLFFLCNRYFIPYFAYEFYRVNDLIAHSALLLCLMLLQREQPALIFILAVVAMTARESALLIVPAGLVYFYSQDGKRNLARFGIYSLVLVSLYAVFRLMTGGTDGAGLTGQFEWHWRKLYSPIPILKQLLIAYTPLFLIPLLEAREFISFHKKHQAWLTLLLCTYMSAFLGVDAERLMMPYVPVYYGFIAVAFSRYRLTDGFPHAFLMLFALICWFGNVYHLWGILRVPSPSYSMVITFAAGISAAGLFIVFRNAGWTETQAEKGGRDAGRDRHLDAVVGIL